ncbi:low molecular weight phosphotyrosine protein phosphatase [Cruoricaptor ignavus]|uniref:protein-tyrosine-phosphatase n=1 Tax=Cruoricaptor ignavus TaxID=1118202 RepID=A0A7M1T2Q9_9FLAO|nr:low molecular weight protein-tyrosine-phosphatase [Cruoricaptor ignavus]QOR74105.1 low molecular weight phosphotyrosine protein phosphatase [Cruoricaptor ignavus]
MKILMVCLGNICRSPLAEGLLKKKVPESFEVDSAGTSGQHEGENPDKRSVETAQKYGLDISQQKSRPIKASDFEYFDRIYCMDKNNFRDVLALAENDEQREKVSLIVADGEVPDPYFGGMEGFEKVYAQLDEATDKIAAELLG